MKLIAFDHAIIDVSLSPLKAKSFFKDKRMTVFEKRILETYLLVRDSKYNEAFDLVQSIKEHHNPYLDAHRNLIYGIVCIGLSRFEESIQRLNQSKDYFIKNKIQYHSFTAIYNLFVAFSNIFDLLRMKAALVELEKLGGATQHQMNRLLRAQFTYYSEIDDSQKVKEIRTNISKHWESFSENDCIGYLVCSFMFEVKKENLDQANDIVAEMKKFRKFHLSENFRYMKKMINFLQSGASVYAYDYEFKNAPILYYQLKVIQGLQEGDQDSAEFYWDKLVLLSSQLFNKDKKFNYLGTKCLFSIALDRLSIKLDQFDIDISHFKGTKEEKLLHILKSANGPIHAKQIFMSIWKREIDSKDDLKKVVRLVSSIKKSHNIQIHSSRGFYSIERKDLSKRSG